MRLLKLGIQGDSLFSDSSFVIDLYATDRVLADDSRSPVEVTRVGNIPSLYSLNLLGIGGVNASGKTTLLKLLLFSLAALQGRYIARGVGPEITAFPACLEKSFSVQSIFWSGGGLYYLKSHFELFDEGDGVAARITDEELWRRKKGRLPKKQLATFGDFRSHCELIATRSGESSLSQDVLHALGDGVSIARTVMDSETNVRTRVGGLASGTLPTAIVQAFDPSVEHLIWNDEADVYRLKFKGRPERSVSKAAASRMLSAGTVVGTELVSNAIEVLREGSYLVVDEIENNLNKTLVETILDLFASPVTNPRGALLVFTTHYPELLDTLHRKDNLCLLVRDQECKTSVIKYSSRMHRIENKKSEVLLSNLIRGTNPSYPVVRGLRDYVKEEVRG